MTNRIKTSIRQNKRLFAFLSLPGLLIAGSFVYFGVEMTSTPQFCSSCHEMKPAYDSWKLSSHYPTNTNQGATCRECHVSSWKRPASCLWEKTYHGVKDVTQHFLSKDEFKYPGFYEHLKYTTYKNFPKATCLDCHKNTLEAKDSRLASYHRDIHDSKGTRSGIKCIDCHKNLVHF